MQSLVAVARGHLPNFWFWIVLVPFRNLMWGSFGVHDGDVGWPVFLWNVSAAKGTCLFFLKASNFSIDS